MEWELCCNIVIATCLSNLLNHYTCASAYVHAPLRVDPVRKNKKGLRERIAPICTLSQNGYGNRRPRIMVVF